MVMTSKERISRMYAHKEADRVPIVDSPWSSTIERWIKEGMPKDVNYSDYFGMDKIMGFGADNGPLYPEKIIEKTEEYTIKTTTWGTTVKNWNHSGGVPEFLDFKITDRASWADAKARMIPDKNRINWARLEKEYKGWKEKGYWLSLGFWFGFDVTHSHMVGTERVLMALVEDPEWITDMVKMHLEMNIALYQQVLDAGYEFDEIMWYDDMGYKGKQFFSVDMYRELFKPYHKKACDWAHERKMKVRLHSCGDINPLVPELIEIGVDMLNPLEVKAGMDPAGLKAKYGDKLAFHGGLNAALFTKMDKLVEEMKITIPAMKKNGGYIVASDHSVPDSVSLEDFRLFVETAKKLGKY